MRKSSSRHVREKEEVVLDVAGRQAASAATLPARMAELHSCLVLSFLVFDLNH